MERAPMVEAKHSQTLDLSRLNVRAKNVLRRLGIDTVEKLLMVTERDMSAIKNCGSKTIAKILMLQKEYGKEESIVETQSMAIDRAIESSMAYMNRLIVVAMAANEVIEGAVKDDRYYFRVTKQRVNTLKRVLEALRETEI